MKAMIHKLSKTQKSVIASFLALVMGFGVFAFIAPVEAQAVELNASSTGFLTYSDKDGKTSFEAGAQIRVINKTRDGKNKSDAIYQTDGNDNWSPVDNDNYLVWQGIDANTFYGIYPAAASYTEFTLPTDQSNVAKLAAADWMTDDYEGAKSDGEAHVTFEHRLAKVTVKITNWTNEYDGAEKVVSEPSIHSKGLELDAAYGDTVEITAGDNGGAILAAITAENEYTAIVMPAAYTSADTFFTFKVDGKPLIVSVGNNATLTNGLEAGKHYNFELTVGKEAVTLSEVTVENWKQENVDGGVAEEVVS